MQVVAQGFDPTRTDDPVYFDDPRGCTYVRIDSALYADIIGGKVRL